MNLTELAQALVALGCPAEKSAEMTSQLDKRARQLSSQKGQSYDDALAHLLGLMKQGWAAQERIQNSGARIQNETSVSANETTES